MPRPTAAQLAYGFATVVLATLAMLLLSGVTSTVGIAAIALVGLGLGVLVSVKVPQPRRSAAAHPATQVRSSRTEHTAASAAENRVPASLRR